MKKLSRILSLLLVFVMVFSFVSVAPVSAAEDDVTVTIPTTELQSESELIPTEETEPILETLPESAEETLTEDMGLFSTRATYQEGKYRQRAVIWNTVGEKVNYTYNGKVNSYQSSSHPMRAGGIYTCPVRVSQKARPPICHFPVAYIMELHSPFSPPILYR